ncbi:hypothetical protein FRAAL1941 [Frankia alni ACN14a]|uniref:Uncharacterized protein n=1 Tax=Frankia alni (strain DSM 45986 / CECT 9034 / ACN14a) TaxID=326424 RepID=Q0RPE2_FRAAA|nr:hypothetical protein FRAAL1941 [Frankia alni ACN14a]
MEFDAGRPRASEPRGTTAAREDRRLGNYNSLPKVSIWMP